MDLILYNGEEAVLIDQTSHIRQLFLDLKMTLFEEGGLEVDQDRQSSFEGENLTVKNHIVPDSAGNLEIDVLHEYSDKPIR